ncbi:MAG: hypothetical protein ACK5MP_14250 [Nostocoides sp.]
MCASHGAHTPDCAYARCPRRHDTFATWPGRTNHVTVATGAARTNHVTVATGANFPTFATWP